MRLPTRRSERLKIKKDEDRYLTEEALARLKLRLEDLQKRELPAAVEEVRRTAEMGDFSENAAYQIAKGNLRRINNRILTLQEELKQAILIPKNKNASGRVRIGSTVVLRGEDGKELIYQILGSREASPGRGRISHVSPLGQALLGKEAGAEIEIQLARNKSRYVILRVD